MSWKTICVIGALSIALVIAQDIPTLTPASPFNPLSEANRLYSALIGLGTDEAAIVDVLCHHVATQRETITSTYNSNFNRNLERDLASDLGGDLETLTNMLIFGTTKFLALELHATTAGAGTNEAGLVELLISRSNQEIRDTVVFYRDYYGHPTTADIEADIPVGPFRNLVLRMLEGSRDETNYVNNTLVLEDVEAMYMAGPAIVGTNEDVFVSIFSSRNYAHIQEVEKQFDATYGPAHILTTVITMEFMVDMQNALYSILQYSSSKAAYLASRFHITITGSGTRERDLMRLTVGRCEIDLGNVKAEYQRIYGTSLSNAVSGDTSGYFRTALLILVG